MSKVARSKLGELLVGTGLIDASQLAAAIGEQNHWGGRLGAILVRKGFVDEETLVRTLAIQLELPVAQIRGRRIAGEALELVPAELAEKHRCLPLFVKTEGAAQVLYLAMEDPADLASLDEVSFRVGVKVRPVLAAPSELQEALQRSYHFASAGGGALEPLSMEPGAGEPGGDAPELLVVEELDPAPVAAEQRLAEQGAAPAPVAVRQDAILRALTQLLVEKGVLTREELIQRVGMLADKGGDDAP